MNDYKLTKLLRSVKIIKNEEELIFGRPLEENVKSAFMTSATDIIYRNQQHYKEFVLTVCKEQVLTVNIVMYFPKNFYLRDAIDRKIRSLSTSGLLQYWTQKYADPKFINIKRNMQSGPKKLNVHHLFGVLNIWAIGLTIALFIFLLEISGSLIKKAFRIV